MAHTNSTTNYSLPQFITTDKPAWLTDINNAFSNIDTGIYAAQSKADTAYADAGTAQGDATSALTNAAAADAKGSGALASIEAAFDPTTIYSVGAKVIYNSLLYRCIVAVVTPGPWTGSDNWERITVDNLISTTDSKIGLLSSLSTTDKSNLVNAVNEVNGSKQDKNSAVQIATFSFQKAVSANAQTNYTCLRSDFSLPAGAKAISVFLREYSPNTVNAGGLIYSAQVDATSSTCVEGMIYNGTTVTRTYYITATVFFTLA